MIAFLQKMLNYWDVKYSKVNAVILFENLYLNINLFQTYKEINKIQTSNQCRILQDGTKLEGNFIFTLSPSGIYSRFSKCFGGNLQGFNYTLNDISRLPKRYFNEEKRRG